MKKIIINNTNNTNNNLSLNIVEPSNNQLINILIRNTYRPSFFKKCIKSILSQTCTNYKIIMCYDDERCLEYLNEYMEHPKIEIFKASEVDKSLACFYNLYCNELLNKVKEGWIMFLDDDDMFMNEKALRSIVNNIRNEDDILLWKVKFSENIIVYPRNISEIKIRDITTCGLCFNSKFKNSSKWVAQVGSDWIYYEKLLQDVYTSDKRIFIDDILTKTIHNSIGLSGFIESTPLEELIKTFSIKQLYVSESLSHLKSRFLNKYKLVEYNNKRDATIFFGLYRPQDFYELIKHNNVNRFLMLGGTDVLNVNRIRNKNNIRFVSVSKNIQNRLESINIHSISVYFNLVDKTLFKPITREERGYKIFVYNGLYKKSDNDKIYNQKIIDEVVKRLPKYEFVYSSELNAPYEKMPEIYAQCFIGLRLTEYDGNANMVQEMETMEIPVVHNHSDYGLKWKTVDDVVWYIENLDNIYKMDFEKLDNFFNLQNKNILINIHSNLNYIAGDVIMIINYMNLLMKNDNKITLLSKYDVSKTFTRNLEYNNYNIITKQNNEEIVKEIDMNANNNDIIFIRNHEILDSLKEKAYLNKTILYGLDIHLNSVKNLDHKYHSIITQSEQLKELYINNGIMKDKIHIIEPFSYKYEFDLIERNDNEIRLIYCGTLRDEENILEIIEEFQKIHLERPEVVLKIIYGKIHGNQDFTLKVNKYIKEGVDGITFKHNLSHRDACYEIATSDIGICWRKNGWGDNGEVSTKVKEYEMYGLEIMNDLKIKVGVVTSTNKLNKIDNIIRNFKEQIYFNKKLFLVINNNDICIHDIKKKCIDNNILYEVISIDEKFNLGYCLNEAIKKLKEQQYEIFSKFDDDDIYEKYYLLEQVYNLNINNKCIVGKHDTILYFFDKRKYFKIKNFDIQSEFTNFCRGSTITYNINKINSKFNEEKITGVDSEFIKNKKIFSTSNKNYIWIRYSNLNEHTWKIDIEKKFNLIEIKCNKDINYIHNVNEFFNGFYSIININNRDKINLYNDEFKTEFITNPTIMKYKGNLNYNNSYLKITPLNIKPEKFIKSKYGIITSSNINSGLIYESNYFIKYINSKYNLNHEIFYFPTSSGRNSNLEYEHNFIYPQNNIKGIYNEGISLKEFINNKKVILIYEIFSEHIFDYILNLNIKIVFLINSDCFINWDHKKNRNSDYNLSLLHKLKNKYNDKFVICTKNIITKTVLTSYSIISQYIPMFIGSDDIIDYKSFKTKFTNGKQINVAIVLGAGYQKFHRKSIEEYLDILYEIIKKNENIIFNIYTPKNIQYNIKSFKNLYIHINKSDHELQLELINTSIAFYFSKHDGLAITPIQLLSCGCYTISTFNDCFDIFDCYILKSYIDTKIVGKKNISNVFEVKNKSQIKVLFDNALQFIANIKDTDLIEYYNNIIDINSYKSLSLSLLLKEFISESYSKNEKILFSGATYPLKKCSILYNVENLIIYADNIYIYLNAYTKIPKIFELLNNTQVFTVKLSTDMKALSKFNIFKEYKNNDFILTIDDDLYYSQEYVPNMIQKYLSLKKKIPKDLIISSVGRIFNNIQIDRYSSPTKIIRIDNSGKSIIKSFHKEYKDEFTDLVGTGNALFYNTQYINDTINSIFTSDISFKEVSLDETLSIIVNNKNIIMVSSSMENKCIFLRNIYLLKYIYFELKGLHELKSKDLVLKQSIINGLKCVDFYNIQKYGFDRINMLIIGWWNIKAFPVNIITNLFSDLNYNIHFYGLKLNQKQNKTNNDITNDIMNELNKNNIQIIYWFNWKFDIDNIKIIKKNNPNVKNVMFNWDPVDSNLNPLFNEYFKIFDFIFISQELNYNYDNKKYIKFYPGFNYNIKQHQIINDDFLGDVCFVITNYYNNRDKLIQKLINNNINVHIYGPEKLKSKFPNNYKYSLEKHEVYNIYNRYKISINLSIYTTATEYINERVAEVFYSKGLILTNLENTILINNFNCVNFKNLDDCVKITKSILMDYTTKNLKKINNIKTNAFNTAIEVFDYRKSILKKHMEIIKII